jgi:hypothetical protein
MHVLFDVLLQLDRRCGGNGIGDPVDDVEEEKRQRERFAGHLVDLASSPLACLDVNGARVGDVGFSTAQPINQRLHSCIQSTGLMLRTTISKTAQLYTKHRTHAPNSSYIWRQYTGLQAHGIYKFHSGFSSAGKQVTLHINREKVIE